MTPNTDSHCVKCFSWKAVLVGALVGFGLIFLFNLLTVAGGLSIYTRTEKGLEVLVSLAYLWTLVGSFLMLFIAGVVTSMILWHYQSSDTGHYMVHGFVTWVLYILISLAFIAHLNEATIVTLPQNFLNVSTTTLDTTDATATVNSATSSPVTSNSSNKGNIDVATQKEVHKIGLATLGAFFIFFVEVIGCCFGAHCGMEHCQRRCVNPKTVNINN